MENYHLLSDYKTIKDAFFCGKDEYDDEYDFHMKVVFGNHSMEHQDNERRFYELEDAMNLILSTPAVIDQSIGSEFSIMSKDLKMKIPCVLEQIEGFYTIIVKTVIRNVEVINDIEHEKKIRIKGKVLFPN